MGTDDNPVAQGKLISHLSTSARSPRPTGSSLVLTSLPSNDCSRSVNNESVYNESVYNESVHDENESICNESVHNESICNDWIYNVSVYNESLYNASVHNSPVYTPSVNSASVSEPHSPSIRLSRTLSTHTISSGVTPTMVIPTTIIPETRLEHNIPARPSSGVTSTVDYPQNPARRPASSTDSSGQSITNAQHNLNANEDHAPAQPAVPSQLHLQQQVPPPRAHVQHRYNEDTPTHVIEKSDRPRRLHTRSSIVITVEPPVCKPSFSTH